MTETDVLSLSAIAPPRDVVTIDHEVIGDDETVTVVKGEYELANPEDFSPAQLHRFNSGAAESEGLWGLPKPTKADSEKLDKLLSELAEMVILGAPPEVVARLSLIHRRGVVLRFWGAFNLESFSALGEKGLAQMAELRKRTAPLREETPSEP